jgi:anti-sigma B factor antagonist
MSGLYGGLLGQTCRWQRILGVRRSRQATTPTGLGVVVPGGFEPATFRVLDSLQHNGFPILPARAVRTSRIGPLRTPVLNPSSFMGEFDGLGVAERWSDRVVVVEAAGTLDALTAPRLTEAIDAASLHSPQAVIVEVKILAAAGMSVVVAPDAIVPWAWFGVVADGPATGRLLTPSAVHELFGMYRTVQDALASVGAAGTAIDPALLGASSLGHG